jgi:dihydroflavonol-4-reductase
MNNDITIGITGASGHIGSRLTGFLSEKGFRVIAFVRNVASVKNVPVRKYDLTEDIASGLVSDIDVLIHCAFVTKDQHADAEHINYHGSKQLFDECRKQGVKKIIFFSTVTASANTKSAYAKSKYRIEQLLRADTDFMIRCSMVIGTGGMFRRMLTYVTSHTFIPVFGSGKQVIQVVAIDDVLIFVEQVITGDTSGSCVLANNEQLTYKEFFSTIASVYHRKICFIHVPVPLVKMLLRLCRLMNIRTTVTEENILGMETLHVYDPPSFPFTLRTLRSKLEELRETHKD